jgi:hypothetical protein
MKNTAALVDAMREFKGSLESINVVYSSLIGAMRASHLPKGYADTDDGRITYVLCACGEEVRYKPPLNTLDDFVCPKERK